MARRVREADRDELIGAFTLGPTLSAIRLTGRHLCQARPMSSREPLAAFASLLGSQHADSWGGKHAGKPIPQAIDCGANVHRLDAASNS